MKTRITYIRQCRKCSHETTYVLRDTNVNPMDNEAAYAMVRTVQQRPDEFHHCEGCSLVTRQTIIAFDY